MNDEQDILYVDNDNLLILQGLRDNVLGGQYLSNATVEATVFTLAGVTVSGVTFPVTLTAAANGPGRYEGTIDEGLAIVKGNRYDVEVTVTSGGDSVAFFNRRVLAVDRTGVE